MWRWLHSLPRVVRLQCNGSGASAGLHVEELNERKDFKKSEEQSGPWRSHCKQKKDEHDGKNGSRPDSHDFWRLVHGPHSPLDAIGLGSVVALGVQMGHFKCLHRQHKSPEETRRHCLLSTIVLHALPPTEGQLPTTQRNIVNKHDSGHHEHIVNKHESSQHKLIEHKQDFRRHKIIVINHDFSQYKHSTNNKVLGTVLKHDERETGQRKKTVEKKSDCESLEEAFRNFEAVCQKYTATGKGIMGSQEAQQGKMKSAAALWKEASELGNAKSRFNLGVCYETGRGVKKDLKQATRLYELAAEDMHPQAMYNLGLMYLEGNAHTSKDTHRGLQLISAAADFGLSEAQCYLGVYYTDEQTENVKKAMHYLALAANQQNADAQYFLGLCYQHGYGMEENMCKASDLFSKAAESGHPDALYSLAVFHKEGLGGLPQDHHCAKRLMEKAALAGCQDAISEIQNLEKPKNHLSTVIKQSTDTNTKKQTDEKESKKVSYQFKLNSSVSSPCLTDLLRQNMIPLNKDLFCDPFSDTGTLSKLYTQLMVPRGFTMTPTVTKVPESRNSSPTQSRTPSPREADSDSGVVFKLGSDLEEEEFSGFGTRDEITVSSIGTTCAGLHRRTSTMPDLNVVTCL